MSTTEVPPPAIQPEITPATATTANTTAPPADTNNGIRKTPLENPLPTCKPTPPAELTDEQKAKYVSLLEVVNTWAEIPSTSKSDSPKRPITDADRLFLTRECLLRYLRATKWAVPSAKDRLLSTVIWRSEYGVEGFTPEYIAPEQETGKQVIMGYDNSARPCLYLNPSRQNTKPSDRQVHHLVFMLERVIDLMIPGQENLALLISYKNSSSSSQPSISTSRQVLSILQNHYPERLGRALITHLPWYVTTFYKLITPFIDPVTKEKMKFNEPLTEHVPAVQLLESSGGEIAFEYEFNTYWPALNGLCEQRRKAYVERWERAGKKVGESEVYLRGGEEASVTA